jgi:hypothetical protein
MKKKLNEKKNSMRKRNIKIEKHKLKRIQRIKDIEDGQKRRIHKCKRAI